MRADSKLQQALRAPVLKQYSILFVKCWISRQNTCILCYKLLNSTLFFSTICSYTFKSLMSRRGLVRAQKSRWWIMQLALFILNRNRNTMLYFSMESLSNMISSGQSLCMIIKSGINTYSKVYGEIIQSIDIVRLYLWWTCSVSSLFMFVSKHH